MGIKFANAWLKQYRQTAGWRDHLRRGSLGGDDFAMYKAKVPAFFGGRVELIPNNGTGGNTLRLWWSSTLYMEYMHLSRFVADDGERVKMGDTIAVSGDTGSPGSWHLHIHFYIRIKGVWKRIRYTTGFLKLR